MAGPYPPEVIESVRNAGDIVRLVSDYVPLKPAGTRLKGLCPFHEEKTPSFSVDPVRQLFYCFGCQTGGDVFKFLMLYEKLPFGEAVESLAKRWGVTLPTPDRGAPRRGPLDRFAELNRAAEAFFRACLKDETTGRAGRDYLSRRGLEAATIERLRLGVAPDGWEALRAHLLSRRFRAEELLAAGLTLSRKSGQGEYDRFRERLIFPIRDLDGRTVAFGGRALGDAEPKYINSPETPLYKKGDHLYGLDSAGTAIRRQGSAVVVEGYMDLAALVQAGFDNVVASLGTAFTPAQARLLSRYTQRVVFSYDGDAAGGAATARSLDLLLAKGFEVRVVELPAGCDPDELIGREGAEGYARRLREAPHYLEFLIRREARTRDLARPEEKVAAANAILPHVARLAGAVERGTWAGRMAEVLRIDETFLLQELRSAVRGAREQVRQRPPQARRLAPAEARLITRLLRSESERARWCPELDLDELRGTSVLPIVRTIIGLARDGRQVDFPSVLHELTEEADRQLLTHIAFRDEPEEGPGVEDCLWAFRRDRLAREGKQAVREISRLLRSDEASPSPAAVDEQLARIQQLARKRDSLLH